MKLICAPDSYCQKEREILVIPVWEEEKKGLLACKKNEVPPEALLPIEWGDFLGKQGETHLLHIQGKKKFRALLLGLGKPRELSLEHLRRAYAELTRICMTRPQCKHLVLLLPHCKGITDQDRLHGILEGMLLPHYSFFEGKKAKEKQEELLDTVVVQGAGKKEEKEIEAIQKTFEAVYWARDLVNASADHITPEYLAEQAKILGKGEKTLSVHVFDKARLEKENLNLILAVGRAGMVDPRMIILEYKGNPQSKECSLVIGKGVTYDTGGLNLKPTGFMETMRSDMGGAAAVLGMMKALVERNIKTNVTAIIPSCENAIDSRSFKPGDVYTSYAGITVEIGNTDAEGRLILADAIAYGKKKFQPKRIIDVATLTGACIIALGTDVIGLLSNNDPLAHDLFSSGERTYERVWRLPLYPEYRELLSSKVADICNIGKGREAGTITAAKFLEEFVGDTPWAHLDIAGKAFLEKPKRYFPLHATGIGVRLLVDFFEHHG